MTQELLDRNDENQDFGIVPDEFKPTVKVKVSLEPVDYTSRMYNAAIQMMLDSVMVSTTRQ